MGALGYVCCVFNCEGENMEIVMTYLLCAVFLAFLMLWVAMPYSVYHMCYSKTKNVHFGMLLLSLLLGPALGIVLVALDIFKEKQ